MKQKGKDLGLLVGRNEKYVDDCAASAQRE